jgi:hypothetical protein
LENISMRLTFILSLCLLLLAAGCAGSEGDLKGPAEEQFSEQNEGDSLPSLLPAKSANGASTEATIAALVANPSAFKGRLLQVEGLFKSAPELICPDKRFGAPASWALADGQDSVAAGGLESLAAALPDGQITLVVEGAWRSWPIPANCRQEGDPTELYYLEVAQVISPNPIALAPGDNANSPVVQLNADNGLADQPLPAASQPETIPTATAMPGPEVTPLPTTISPAGQPLATTGSGETGAYPGPVPPPTPNPGAYPGPAGQTPEPEEQATEPAGEEPLERDLLSPGSLETGSLAAGISEQWRYVSIAPQTIEVQIMPDARLDLIATVLDQNGQVLQTNTTTAPGEIVTLPAVNLREAGEFTILLTTLDDGAGNYAILLSDEETYDFTFQENLMDGVAQAGMLQPDSDHFYFFSGSAGDVVDLTVSPLEEADLFLRLFDPSGKALFTFHDENPAGQAESFSGYRLPEAGLYSLLIGEEAFVGGAYEVVLERP